MASERYKIQTHEAHKIPRFYQEDQNVKGLEFDSRENGTSIKIVYNLAGFKGARCTLTMHTLYNSLGQFVEISRDEKDEFPIRRIVEDALEIKLLNSFPSQ